MRWSPSWTHDPRGLAPRGGERATLHRTLRRGRLSLMVPEARLESTETGLVPEGDGWFVLNAREARWRHGQGRAAICEFEGRVEPLDIGRLHTPLDELRTRGVDVGDDPGCS